MAGESNNTTKGSDAATTGAVLLLGGAAILEAVALTRKAQAQTTSPTDQAVLSLLTAIAQAVNTIEGTETDILTAVKAISIPAAGGANPMDAAQFLMDAPKVLAMIETASPSDCNTSPMYFNLELSPGQTVVIDDVAPQGKVNISNGVFVVCDTPEVITATISFDGKQRVVVPSGPAMAGRYPFLFYGYNACSVVEFRITNNHIGTVGITGIGFGA